MSRLEQAKAVIEFAKANGFPNANMYLWSEEGERSYDTPDEAVDELDDGVEAEFSICLHLDDVTLRQEVLREGDDEYSNAVEVIP